MTNGGTRAWPILLLSLLVAVTVFAPVVMSAGKEVSHTNFDSAEADMAVFNQLMRESLVRYEAVLNDSWRPASTVWDDRPTLLSIEPLLGQPHYTNDTVRILKYIDTNLSGMESFLSSATDLGLSIPDEAGSGDYLRDFIEQVTGLWENASVLEQAHKDTLGDLALKYGLIIQENTSFDPMEYMSDARRGLVQADGALRNLRELTPEVNDDEGVLGSINVTFDRVDRALDHYWDILLHLEDLMGMNDTILHLELNRTSVYIEDSVEGWGYAYFRGTYRTGYWYEVHIGELAPVRRYNPKGIIYFEIDLPASVGAGPIDVNVTFEIDGVDYTTSNLTLNVLKLPVRLKMEEHPHDLSPDELMIVVASVHDIRGRTVHGLDAYSNVDRGGVGSSSSSINGLVSVSVQGGSEWGWHVFNVTTPETERYQPGIMESGFNLNRPTSLGIALKVTVIETGEDIEATVDLDGPAGVSLAGLWVWITVDEELWVKVQVNEQGEGEVMVEGLHPGTYSIGASFISSDPSLRNSTSEETQVLVKATKSDDSGTLPTLDDLVTPDPDNIASMWWVFLILAIILVMIALIIVLRRRAARQPTEVEDEEEVEEGVEVEEVEKEAKVEIPKFDLGTDPALSMTAAYLELLYVIFEAKGPRWLETATPREINDRLVKLGYPEDACESVTSSIEALLYSGTPADKAEAKRFISSARKIAQHRGSNLEDRAISSRALNVKGGGLR